MLINEVMKQAGLTKKAIEYYLEKGFIFPNLLYNGYRDFSDEDVVILKKIATFRKLGLSTTDIKMILKDNEVLQRIAIQRKIKVHTEKVKVQILNKIAAGIDFSEIETELKNLEQSTSISEKLLEIFPGYYGRFISLHFSRFLQEPIKDAKQQDALAEIINFLDEIPMFNFPDDLKAYIDEMLKHADNSLAQDIINKTKQSIENPDDFLKHNKEMIDTYLAFKESEAYKNSAAYKIQTIIKEFNNTTGYYDIFIPAMKRLSKTYAEYHRQLEIANEKLLAQYPNLGNDWSESKKVEE